MSASELEIVIKILVRILKNSTKYKLNSSFFSKKFLKLFRWRQFLVGIAFNRRQLIFFFCRGYFLATYSRNKSRINFFLRESLSKFIYCRRTAVGLLVHTRKNKNLYIKHNWTLQLNYFIFFFFEETE